MCLLNCAFSRSPLYDSTELLAGAGLASGFEHPAATAPASASAASSARRVRSTFELGAAVREERQVSGTSDVELRELAYLNLDLAKHQVDGSVNVLDDHKETADAAAVDDGLKEDQVDHAAEQDDIPPTTTVEVPK